jgi:hypothetical protein
MKMLNRDVGIKCVRGVVNNDNNNNNDNIDNNGDNKNNNNGDRFDELTVNN